MGFSPSSHWLFERMRIASERFEAVASQHSHRRKAALFSILAVTTPIVFVAWELKSSWVQSQFFTSVAKKLTYGVEPGPSPGIYYPDAGPYDQKLGYSKIPRFQERLQVAGFEVSAQARDTKTAATVRGLGRFSRTPSLCVPGSPPGVPDV